MLWQFELQIEKNNFQIFSVLYSTYITYICTIQRITQLQKASSVFSNIISLVLWTRCFLLHTMYTSVWGPSWNSRALLARLLCWQGRPEKSMSTSWRQGHQSPCAWHHCAGCRGTCWRVLYFCRKVHVGGQNTPQDNWSTMSPKLHGCGRTRSLQEFIQLWWSWMTWRA